MIMMEWDHVMALLNTQYGEAQAEAREWTDAYSQARWYLYHRPDSMGSGYAANFECLALDTPLPTPTGWTTMGEVREGDLLLSDTGEPTKVIGLSDIKHEAKCYEVRFDDGTVIVADENHWWKVARRHWKGGADKLRQTKQLEAGKFYIRQAKPLRLAPRELPIDPYLLGVWLGDGFSDGARIACGDQDVEEMVANIEACGQPTRRTRHRTCWNIGFSEGRKGKRGSFLGRLRDLNLLKNKHIPDIYLRASFGQRLALLQGLMDTDGTSGGNGGPQCAFTTNRPALAEGFSELVRSLGIKAKYLIGEQKLMYKGRCVECSPKYQFWFTAYPDMTVFRLKRKVDRTTQRERTRQFRPCHRILSVTEVPSVPVRCVMVDSPTKMFLAGKGMIPTHNTTWRTKMEIMHQMRGAYVTRELVIRSRKLLEEMRIVVQDGSEIGAPESSNEDSKDDRVFATALATRAWINWRRPEMLANGETYEAVMGEETGEISKESRSLNGLVFRFLRSQEELRANPMPPLTWRQQRGLE
jgi:hypothetical protein